MFQFHEVYNFTDVVALTLAETQDGYGDGDSEKLTAALNHANPTVRHDAQKYLNCMRFLQSEMRYENPLLGCSFSLPDGWTQLSDVEPPTFTSNQVVKSS